LLATIYIIKIYLSLEIILIIKTCNTIIEKRELKRKRLRKSILYYSTIQEETREINSLASKSTIYSNCRDQINVIDATLTYNRDTLNASQRKLIEIATNIKTKVIKIKKLYKSKERNVFETILIIVLTK
jgi:hypothetical protein